MPFQTATKDIFTQRITHIEQNKESYPDTRNEIIKPFSDPKGASKEIKEEPYKKHTANEEKIETLLFRELSTHRGSSYVVDFFFFFWVRSLESFLYLNASME